MRDKESGTQNSKALSEAGKRHAERANPGEFTNCNMAAVNVAFHMHFATDAYPAVIGAPFTSPFKEFYSLVSNTRYIVYHK